MNLLVVCGLYANPTRGAQLFVSFFTGPGTMAARLSGSVAPNMPNGTSEISYRSPKFSVSAESHAEIVLRKEEGLPLMRDKVRGLQRLLNAERRVVHVVLQVVERERPLRVEGGAVGDVVVADVRAHLHRVLRPGPRERVRELIGVADAALREIAVAANLEEAGDEWPSDCSDRPPGNRDPAAPART